MLAKIKKLVEKFTRDDTGSIMTMTAVMTPVILGFAGVGLDLTYLYMEKRAVQNLVDSGSMMGAHSLSADTSDETITALIKGHIADLGFDQTTDKLTMSTPPTSGVAAGRNGFVEVTINRTLNSFFMSYFGLNDFVATGRAVAGKVVIGDQCIVALDETLDRAIDITGTASVNADCGVMSNSSSAEAIYIGGKASLTADPAQSHGDILINGSATLVTNSPLQTFTGRLDDPYSDLTIPPLGSCDYYDSGKPYGVGDNLTLSPGRYCGGIDIKGKNVTFQPGTYIIDEGDFTSNANASFSGDGVTIILTATAAADVGNVNLNGGASADLTAPTSGDYKGILFYQDQNAASDSSSNANQFNGGTDLNLDGVIYIPNQAITFNGGAAANPACLQIVARKVTFSGNSDIGNDSTACDSLGIEKINQTRIQIVE